MSLNLGFKYKHNEIEIVGYSLAGISTCFYYPEVATCIDVAQGLPFALGARHFLITHSHQDHAGGIPYVISQQNMMNLPTPTFYMPEYMLEPIEQILQTWQKIEGHTYRYNLVSVELGKEYPVKNGYFFKAFLSDHRVTTFGYTIFKSHKKLRADLTGAASDELIRRKSQGESIDTLTHEPLISYTGDTKIEVLDNCAWLKDSKLLLLEVTFWDSQKPIANAREWGHIHLDEVLPRLKHLNCEAIVLCHASVRYSTEYLNDLLKKRLSPSDRERVFLFPRP